MTGCRCGRAPPAPQLFDEKHGRGPLTLHRVSLEALLHKLGAFEDVPAPPWTRGARRAVWSVLAARRGRPVTQLALRLAIMPRSPEGRRRGVPGARASLPVVISQLRRQSGEPILRVEEGYMLPALP